MLLTIKEPTLRELIAASSVESALVVGQKGGFAIRLRYGLIERNLATARGEVRVFANLNTAASFLRKRGITKFEVDATEYEPGRLRKARPDRAAALRNTRTNPRQTELL